MAANNWSYLSGGLDANTVARGATAGVTPPTGGGTMTFVFNSLVDSDGAVGLYHNGGGFSPAASGARLSGAMKRLPSAGPTGFSPFLFVALQSSAVSGNAYLLGLSDEDPHRIVLRKGSLANGIGASSGTGVLRASTDTFAAGTWLHLRLDALTNDNGDVVLKVYRNTNTVASPVWVAIPGMADFIDDLAGINSGSLPYTSGYMGFAFQVSDIGRRAAFDYIEMFRQPV